MCFRQSEAGSRRRFRRVENFGFVMRGDFFWRHWDFGLRSLVFGLWSLVFGLQNIETSSRKIKDQKPKAQDLPTYLSASLPFRCEKVSALRALEEPKEFLIHTRAAVPAALSARP